MIHVNLTDTWLVPPDYKGSCGRDAQASRGLLAQAQSHVSILAAVISLSKSSRRYGMAPRSGRKERVTRYQVHNGALADYPRFPLKTTRIGAPTNPYASLSWLTR